MTNTIDLSTPFIDFGPFEARTSLDLAAGGPWISLEGPGSVEMTGFCPDGRKPHVGFRAHDVDVEAEACHVYDLGRGIECVGIDLASNAGAVRIRMFGAPGLRDRLIAALQTAETA